MRGRPVTPIGTFGSISTTQQDDGKWVASTWLRKANGSRQRVRRTGKSKSQAETRLKEACRELVDTTRGEIVSNSSTVNELLGEWIKRHEVSETTRESYKKFIARHLKDSFGEVRLFEVSAPRIQLVLEELSIGNARTARAILGSAFKQAVLWGAISVNPVPATKLPKKTKSKVVALQDEEIQAFRDVIEAWCGTNQMGPKRGESLLEIVDVLIGTGLRIGEVLGLRWEDVNFDKGTVAVRGQVDGKGGWKPTPKTESSRRILPVAPIGLKALRRQWESPGREYLGEAVFPTYKGTFRTVQNVETQLRKAKGKKFKEITPHTFRKTVGTRIEQKYGLMAAARHLGHASSTVTEQSYIAREEEVPNYVDSFAWEKKSKKDGKEST